MNSRGDSGAPRRSRLPAAQRRETILAAAAEVFGEAGYRAAKVADVAARVGVSEPVIFQNFGSKAALFAAVIERAAADVRASLDDLAGHYGSASGLLHHVLAGPAHGLSGHGGPERGGPERGGPERGGPERGTHAAAGLALASYGVLFADAATLAGEPELTGPARGAARAVAAHLADLIRNAQADGGIRPDADPDAAAWLLLSVLSARRLRTAAMPVELEPAVAALALAALAPRQAP